MYPIQKGTAYHRPTTRDQYEALQTTREVQTTGAFRQQYAARAGVESTTSKPFGAVACDSVATSDCSASGQSSFWACSSMKLPVPAAQTVFMRQKFTRPVFQVVNFESWPPISMMVSTSGLSSQAARA